MSKHYETIRSYARTEGFRAIQKVLTTVEKWQYARLRDTTARMPHKNTARHVKPKRRPFATKHTRD